MTDQVPAQEVDNTQAVQPDASNQPWYTGIEDESIRGYAELKGWKDPASVIDSYRNLEKLRGVPENELLRLPKEDDADGWSNVHARLGRPDTPDLYELPIPDGDDGEFMKAMSEGMHKAGLSKAQAHQLAELNNTWVEQQMKAHADSVAVEQDRQMTELKTEWGQAYDQNAEIARRGAQQFGIDEAGMNAIENAIGTKALMTMFHNIGSKLGEGRMIQGESDGFRLSPAAAKERIGQLQADKEWGKRYTEGGAKEKEEMGRLVAAAYPS